MSYEFSSNAPIYFQIMNDIKCKIVKGEYPLKGKVEPVRDLAMMYGANPNTVQRALQELEREGFLKSERTAGRFICDDQELVNQCKKSLGAQFVDQYFDQITSIGLTLDDGIKLVQDYKSKGETLNGK